MSGMSPLACPVNITPTCLTVRVGERGSKERGRIILGIIVAPNKGLLCGLDGLELDPCAVQRSQFGKKTTTIFSSGVTFVQGLV